MLTFSFTFPMPLWPWRLGQGHRNCYGSVKLNRDDHHAKFERPRLHSLWERADVKESTTQTRAARQINAHHCIDFQESEKKKQSTVYDLKYPVSKNEAHVNKNILYWFAIQRERQIQSTSCFLKQTFENEHGSPRILY